MNDTLEPVCAPLAHLDARQIAMLKAMGVRVWQQPATPPSATPHPQTQASAQVMARPPVTTPASAPAPTPASSSSPEFNAAIAAPAARERPGAAPPHGASQLSWGELRQAVSECELCGLCKHRKNTVFGVGPEGADLTTAPKVDWLLVGEAPGEQEDLAGEPFVGQAGKLLDNMLACLGLSRNSAQGGGLYIANTLKCRPPANRNPSPQESAACAPWLARQIELLQPRLIVAMGRFAAQSLLAESLPEVEKIPLGKLRGQIHHYRNTPVVVTYHPAYLLRNLPDKAKAWEDWVLASGQVKN